MGNLLEIFNLLEAFDEEDKYKVKVFSYDEFFKIIGAQNISNKRFNIKFFKQSKKHFDGFYCLMDQDSIVAAALVRKNVLGLNDKYIYIIQSLQKGCGYILLNHIFTNYKNVWLLSSPGEDGLITYYDNFNIKKFILIKEKSAFNTDISFYHTFNDENSFSAAIENYYGKKSLTENFENNIKSAVMKLGFFKHVSNDGTTYLFRDTADPKKMANFIRVGINSNKKVLTIYGFSIDPSNKGMGKRIIDAIFSTIDSSWTINLDHNFNPNFWKHLNIKYYPDFTFVSI